MVLIIGNYISRLKFEGAATVDGGSGPRLYDIRLAEQGPERASQSEACLCGSCFCSYLSSGPDFCQDRL